jgi:hypothetical protein
MAEINKTNFKNKTIKKHKKGAAGYKIERTKLLKFTDTETGVLSIHKTDKSMLSMADIKDLNKMMNEKNKDKKMKFYIRAFGGLPMPLVLKPYDEYFDDDDSQIDDYIRGKVQNTEKFKEMFRVEIGYTKII